MFRFINNKEKFTRLTSEANNLCYNNYLQYLKNKEEINIYKNSEYLMLDVIVKLCERLNISNTQDKQIIKRSDIDVMMEDTEFIEHMKVVFHLSRDQRKDKNKFDIKTLIGIINQIFSKWGFSKIVARERERKVIEGERIYITNYEIQCEYDIWNNLKVNKFNSGIVYFKKYRNK